MNQVQAVVCPHCQGQVQGDPQYAGMGVSCPYCKQAFQMPTVEMPVAAPVPIETTEESTQDLITIDTSTSRAEVDIRCHQCGELNVFPVTQSGEAGECFNCGSWLIVPTATQARYNRRKEQTHYQWVAVLAGIVLATWFFTRDMNVVFCVLMLMSLIWLVSVFTQYSGS